MITQKEIFKTIYLLPVVIGVLGNGYLFYNYGFHFITQIRSKHIDLILMHLVFVNAMFLLVRGIPAIIDYWDLNYILNDVVCKIMIYPRKVYRGLSLCSTCLLSGYQTIAISPSSLKWTGLKTCGPKCIFPCCVLCWILNLLIEFALPLHVIGLRNSTNSKGINKFDYCSLKPQTENALQIQLWKSIYVTMCVVFMAITSGYMVYVLYKHHQRVQHIHSSLAPRASPEIRATKVILMLVSIFFFFNTMCSILTTYADYYQGTEPWTLHIATIMSMSFQVVSPFVLIKGDSRIPQILCGLLQRMKYSSMISSSTMSCQAP